MSVGSTSISAVVPDTVFATHFMAVLRLPDSTHIQNQMQKMLPIATTLLDVVASACCTRGRAGVVTFSVCTSFEDELSSSFRNKTKTKTKASGKI